MGERSAGDLKVIEASVLALQGALAHDSHAPVFVAHGSRVWTRSSVSGEATGASSTVQCLFNTCSDQNRAAAKFCVKHCKISCHATPLVVCADCAAKCVAKQGKTTDRAQGAAI